MLILKALIFICIPLGLMYYVSRERKPKNVVLLHKMNSVAYRRAASQRKKK